MQEAYVSTESWDSNLSTSDWHLYGIKLLLHETMRLFVNNRLQIFSGEAIFDISMQRSIQTARVSQT